MTVIPFASFRFTPDDIRNFNKFADSLLYLGRWTRIHRTTKPHCDEIQIWTRGRIPPTFCIARLSNGTYCLEFNDGLTWRPLREDANLLSDCLMSPIFNHRIVKANASKEALW